MSQTQKLLDILLDGKRHTVPFLIGKVYGIKKGPTSARLAARVCDLRKRGYKIESDKLKGTKWWYQMEKEKRVAFKKKVGL